MPIAKTDHGEIPVAMISIAYQEHRAYPHAVWFPEASPRLRLEIGLKFLVQLKENNLVLIYAKDETVRYFRHMCRYGVLKAVGKIQSYHAKGDDAMLFQSRTE